MRNLSTRVQTLHKSVVIRMHPYSRSTDEVKKKWRDLVRRSKEAATFKKKEIKRTGGGKKPKDLTPQQQHVRNYLIKISIIIEKMFIVNIQGTMKSHAFRF